VCIRKHHCCYILVKKFIPKSHHYCFDILKKAEEQTAIHRGIRVPTLKYDCDLLLVLMNINTDANHFPFDIHLLFLYAECQGIFL
jgi:hypothetical protein